MAHSPPNRAGPISCALLAILLAAADAAGCPVCGSGTGRQVRAGIVDGDFGLNLLATLLPFSVVLGVVALIHFGPPRRKKNPPRGDGGDHGV